MKEYIKTYDSFVQLNEAKDDEYEFMGGANIDLPDGEYDVFTYAYNIEIAETGQNFRTETGVRNRKPSTPNNRIRVTNGDYEFIEK